MVSGPQRRLRGRLGGLTTSTRHDPNEQTAAARQASWQKWLDLVDPDHVLDQEERERRATAARRLHMARLAWLSARARSSARRRRPGDAVSR